MHKIEKHSGKIVVIESIKGKYVFIGVHRLNLESGYIISYVSMARKP